MFNRLVNDITEAVITKLAARSNPYSGYNKRESDRRALAFLSTDRTDYDNASRNAENAMLGINNDRSAAKAAREGLRSTLKKKREFTTIENLVRELV